MDSPRFQLHQAVIHRTRRELGQVVGEPEAEDGEWWYRVQLRDLIVQAVEEDLDPAASEAGTIEEIALEGSWGQLGAFRRAIALARLERADGQVLYSYRSQRILFQAYQYKPLLKFLQSPDRRLLIADEVGLGKTIEAGLILTELQSRTHVSVVLVACPSRLRDKWREELNRKFGQSFEIYSGKELLQAIRAREDEEGQQQALYAIASLETMRRKQVAEELAARVGNIDLLIVDEAHHGRNRSTLTSKLLRDLAGQAEAALMLSATPIHLGSGDLHTLLHTLRPSEFPSPEALDLQLRQYEFVRRAASAIRSCDEQGRRAALEALEGGFGGSGSMVRQTPLSAAVIGDLQSTGERTRRDWIELERRINELHPNAGIITRTRKRDVQEKAAVRQAVTVNCEFTEQEQIAYDDLMAMVRSDAESSGSSLAAITRSRQAASSLRATLRNLGLRADLGETDPEDSDMDREVADWAALAAAGERLRISGDVDSKLEKLDEILCGIEAEHPGSKVVVFTTFRATASYLEQELGRRGHRCKRIDGSVPSDPSDPERDVRGLAIRDFREDPEIRVLVSTEVGSEGLDFQFASNLVNYDLPWNPMVVEQRIGRIDRFGQEAPKIGIWNMVLNGSIEDRIRERLFDRIGVFRQSIGDLEPILGSRLNEIANQLLNQKLSPEQAERETDRIAAAVEQQRVEEERLEREAHDLLGHEDYIRDQLNRVDRLGRYLTTGSLFALLEAYIEHCAPGATIWLEDDGQIALRPTDEVRRRVRQRARDFRSQLPRGREGVVRFTADGQRAYEDESLVLLNANHPLVQLAKEELPEELKRPAARTGAGVVELGPEDLPELRDEHVAIFVYSLSIGGLRPRSELSVVGVGLESRAPLVEDGAELLLHRLLESGQVGGSTLEHVGVPKELYKVVEGCVRRQARRLRQKERLENDARCAQRRAILERERDFRVGADRERLATARRNKREERILRMFEGKLAKTEASFDDRLQALDDVAAASADASEPLAACLTRVYRRGEC